MYYSNEFNDTIEPKQKYVIVYSDASTEVIESDGYPNLAQYGIAEDVQNVVTIVKCK